MSISSYLVHTSSSYCFRLAVPSDLRNLVGKTEIRYSLKTGSKSEAKPNIPYFLRRGLACCQKKAGNLVGIKMSPHDLRRHAATYVSRAGTPIEIVSKVILRYSNLSTTQRCLGKVSDQEAMYWIENLHR